MMFFVEFIQTGQLLRVRYLAQCGSTNTEMAHLVQAEPQLKPLLLVTDNQTAGRGRAGRQWTERKGLSLATSYFLPDWPAGPSPTLIPLVAGVALAKALRQWVPAAVKWPNDLLVPPSGELSWGELSRQRGGLKIAGLLCEQAVGGVIIGAGVNLLTPAVELPDGAASLAALGAAGGRGFTEIADQLLSVYVSQLFAAVALASRSPERLVQELAAQLATLGQRVRVVQADGSEIAGVATGLTAEGALELTCAEGRQVVVTAGDVHHLRLL